MSRLLKRRKIDNGIAERYADARASISWFENAKREIFQRKMRVRFNLDERFERHQERNVRARKSSRGSLKLQLPNDVTNFRRALIRSRVISQSRQAKTVS